MKLLRTASCLFFNGHIQGLVFKDLNSEKLKM